MKKKFNAKWLGFEGCLTYLEEFWKREFKFFIIN